MTSINFNKISSDTIEVLKKLPPDQEKKTLEMILNTPGYIHTFLPKDNKTIREKFVSYLFQQFHQAQTDKSRLNTAELYKKGLRVCVRYAKEIFSRSSSFFGELSPLELLKKSFTCRFATEEVRLPLALLQIYKIDLIFNETIQQFQEGQQNKLQFEEYGKKTAQLFEQFIRTQSLGIQTSDATYDDIIELLHLSNFSHYCQFEELELYTIDVLISILSTPCNAVYWRREEVQHVFNSNSKMCYEVLKEYLKNISLKYITKHDTKIYVDPRALVLIELPCMRFHIDGIYIESSKEIPHIIEILEAIVDKDSFKNRIQKLCCPRYSITPEQLYAINLHFPLLNRLFWDREEFREPSDSINDEVIIPAMQEKSAGASQKLLFSLMKSDSVDTIKIFLACVNQGKVKVDRANPYHQKIVALLIARVLDIIYVHMHEQSIPQLKKINDTMIQEETEHNLLNRLITKKLELRLEVESLSQKETKTLNADKICQLLQDLSTFEQVGSEAYLILSSEHLYDKIRLLDKSQQFHFLEQIKKQYIYTYIEMSIEEHEGADFYLGMLIYKQAGTVQVLNKKLELLQQAEKHFQSHIKTLSSEIHPSSVNAKFNLGETLYEQSEIVVEQANELKLLKQAQECYQQVVSIQPKHFQAKYKLGYVLHTQARIASEVAEKLDLLKQAEVCFKQFLEGVPTYIEVIFNLGLVLLEQSHIVIETEKLKIIGEAQKFFQKALEIDPNYTRAMNSLGNSFQVQAEIAQETNEKLKLIEQADQCYQKVLKINPNDITANYCLSLSLFRQSETVVEQANKLSLLKQAQEVCQKALSIDPNYVKAALNLGNILLKQAKIISETEKLELLQQAQECYHRIRAIKPTDTDVIPKLTILLEQLKIK